MPIDNIKSKSQLLDCVFLAQLICTENEEERLKNIRRALQKAEEFGVKDEFKEMLCRLHSENSEGGGIVLDFDKKGNVSKTIENFMNIFRKDEMFSTLRFNELTGRGEIDSKIFNDAIRSKCIYHIEKTYGLKSERDFDIAINVYLQEKKYHPVREKIASLQWDGKPRIEKFFHKVMGAKDDSYSAECSRLVFHCGIARIFNPGCKVDDVIVLQGEQGNGKSTLASWLAMNDDWYGRVSDIKGNVGIEQIQGKWICEISELLAVSGKERQEEAKQYLDRKSDNYRRPYAIYSEEIPRQCIFIGTTNLRKPFSDKTGNRRYYPVWCNIKPGKLYAHEKNVKAYIEQCWAEAYALWQKGEILHAVRQDMLSIVVDRQKNALEDDWKIGYIESFLKDKTETCILEIWTEALQMPDKPNLKQSRELGLILDSLDEWERGEERKMFGAYKQQRYWRRKTGADLVSIDDDYVEVADK